MLKTERKSILSKILFEKIDFLSSQAKMRRLRLVFVLKPDGAVCGTFFVFKTKSKSEGALVISGAFIY